ncbi:MAG: metal ABC transporter permease [Oligoflexales bacterium]|nr:metal ABC transporter permease [Oligoflexales bacterium]
MIDAISFLAPPFAMCVVLTGIHCYLGLHVLARGVIFVDLSLAQVAAFGATFALSIGLSPDSSLVYLCSLMATFLAAYLFAIARRYEEKFSQEAIIGIVYALGSASVVLLVNNMSHGAEHIKQLLVGQILWVSWFEVLKTACIYACVGFVHYLFRRQLIEASFSGRHVGSKWDFLFYGLFGVVITSSVQVAGVLQVFSFLIVPALTSTLFFKSVRSRLIFGWIFATLLSFLGLALSFVIDVPSGAFIVVCFSCVPVLILLLGPLFLPRLFSKT